LKRQLRGVLDSDEPSLANEKFVPPEPQSLKDTRLTSNEVETLVLKFLLHAGTASGRRICEHLKLPYHVMKEVLDDLKSQMLVAYKGAAGMGDYICELESTGEDRARRAARRCTYFGAPPCSTR
jgi:hypothetical protein